MIVTELHWDYEKIGALPWSHVVELLEYWAEVPPLAKLANLYLTSKGFKLIKSSQPTDFEESLVQKYSPLDLQKLPNHLLEFMNEVQRNKANGKRGR
jgi:hypothetical protein